MEFSIPFILFSELLLFFSIPLYKKNNKKFNSHRLTFGNTFQIPILSIILLFFVGFRAYIFTDFISYFNIFDEAPTFFNGSISDYLFRSKYQGIESGYLLYNIILKSFGFNFFGFQIISFLIDYLILYSFFIDNNVKPEFGFLFFFVFYGFTMQFNLFRNDKSIMLFILSIKYLKEKRITKYMLLNILGCCFHITSVFYLLLYPILIHKFKFRTYLVLILGGYIIYITGFPLLRTFLFFLSEHVGGKIGFLLRGYLGTKEYSYRSLLSIGFLERTLSFFLFFFVYRKKGYDNDDYIYLNLFCIYFAVFLYCSEIRILVERLPLLFASCYWILYPRVYQKLKKIGNIFF